MTVLTLATTAPSTHGRRTGSAEPYRQEDVGFEISGRLLWVLDVGNEVEGRVTKGDGQVVREGDVIAVVDSRRYDQRAKAVRLKRATAEAALATQRVDLEKVAPADVQAARAQEAAGRNEMNAVTEEVTGAQAAYDVARKTWEREDRLLKSGSGTRAEVDRARSERDRALARLNQAKATVEARRQNLEATTAARKKAEASLELKRAQVAASEAEILELAQSLSQAEDDVRDCTLRAPFSGRITTVHTSAGGLVSPSKPVVTLTLMDPMKVSIAVSADDDRRLRLGDAVELGVQPEEEGTAPVLLRGMVAAKGEVADPATRTFRIDVMTRNVRLAPRGRTQDKMKWPRVQNFAPVLERFAGEGGPAYIFTESLLPGESQPTVLRLPDLNFRLGRKNGSASWFTPEKVVVTLEDDFFSVLKWSCQRIAPGSGLRLGDMLIIHPEKKHLSGVLLGSPEWALRPGDLIPLDLDLGRHEKGFYVPVAAVATLNDATSVFVLGEDDTVRRVPVTVHDSFEHLRRIEGAELTEGLRIVVKGIHYLSDGDTVTVTGEEAGR